MTGIHRSGMDQVSKWLSQGGLGKYNEHFANCGVDESLFRNLLMQDYPKYGVQALEDKQRLFRLIKTVNSGLEPMPEQPPTPPPFFNQGENQSCDSFLSPELRDARHGLLDIHAIDDSELLDGGNMADPFNLSLSFIDKDQAPAPRPPPPAPSVPMLERENQRYPPISRNRDSEPSFASVPANARQTDPSPRRPSTPLEKEVPVNAVRQLKNDVARIRVVVRKRPLNKKEQMRKEDDIVTIAENACSLTLHEPKLKVDLTAYIERHEFFFDAVLDERYTNDEVYSHTVEPIVPCIFNRTKATCFAYGQTGSGKTYTMQPLPLRAAQDMLNQMAQKRRDEGEAGLCLWLSFFEIYGGKVFDLLNDRGKLCMREDGRQQVCIVGLKEFHVLDVMMVKELIDRGNSSRSTGSTGANEESSRSHAILQLALKRHRDGDFAKPGKPVGKFSFIDLAGSERGADTTDNDRQTRIEGAEINKSLLALKECIRALDHDQGHIPFRGSKLTEVLRDSFMGDSRTVMIANISPNTGSCEHTLNTLRYADRVKSLSRGGNQRKDSGNNAAVISSNNTRNEDPTPAPLPPHPAPPLPAPTPASPMPPAPTTSSSREPQGQHHQPPNKPPHYNPGHLSNPSAENPFQARPVLMHSPAPPREVGASQRAPPGDATSALGGDPAGLSHGAYAGAGRMGLQDGGGRGGNSNAPASAASAATHSEREGDAVHGGHGLAPAVEKAGVGWNSEELPRGARARFGFDRAALVGGQLGGSDRDSASVGGGGPGRYHSSHQPSSLPEVVEAPSRQERGERERERERELQSHLSLLENGLLSRQSFERSPLKAAGLLPPSGGGSAGTPPPAANSAAAGPAGASPVSQALGRWENAREEHKGRGGPRGESGTRRRTLGSVAGSPDGSDGTSHVGLPPVRRRTDAHDDGDTAEPPPGLVSRRRLEDRSNQGDHTARSLAAELADGASQRRWDEAGGSATSASEAGNTSSASESPGQFRVYSARSGSDAPESQMGNGMLPEVHGFGRHSNNAAAKEVVKLSSNGGVGRYSFSSAMDAGHATPSDNSAREQVRMEADNNMLLKAHDEVITAILKEEQAVIAEHRKQVEETIQMLKEEMRLLTEVDKAGSRIDDYVEQLTKLLARKATFVRDLQEHLATFHRHLKEEDSRSCGFPG